MGQFNRWATDQPIAQADAKPVAQGGKLTPGSNITR